MKSAHSLSSAECLAKSLSQIEPAAWPKVVERFSETLALQEWPGSIRLSGNSLLLRSDLEEHVIQIRPAA